MKNPKTILSLIFLTITAIFHIILWPLLLREVFVFILTFIYIISLIFIIVDSLDPKPILPWKVIIPIWLAPFLLFFGLLILLAPLAGL